jgi:hypothetical protein
MRWDRVKELFGRALEVDPEARTAFLLQACGADESLRAELQSLLASYASEATTSVGIQCGGNVFQEPFAHHDQRHYEDGSEPADFEKKDQPISHERIIRPHVGFVLSCERSISPLAAILP